MRRAANYGLFSIFNFQFSIFNSAQTAGALSGRYQETSI